MCAASRRRPSRRRRGRRGPGAQGDRRHVGDAGLGRRRPRSAGRARWTRRGGPTKSGTARRRWPGRIMQMSYPFGAESPATSSRIRPCVSTNRHRADRLRARLRPHRPGRRRLAHPRQRDPVQVDTWYPHRRPVRLRRHADLRRRPPRGVRPGVHGWTETDWSDMPDDQDGWFSLGDNVAADGDATARGRYEWVRVSMVQRHWADYDASAPPASGRAGAGPRIAARRHGRLEPRLRLHRPPRRCHHRCRDQRLRSADDRGRRRRRLGVHGRQHRQRAASSVVVDDDMLAPANDPTLTSGDLDHDGILDVDETWTYEAHGTAVAGAYANTGSVSAIGGEDAVATDSDDAGYYGSQPGISLDATTNGGDGTAIHVGDAVTWTYRSTTRATSHWVLSQSTTTSSRRERPPLLQRRHRRRRRTRHERDLDVQSDGDRRTGRLRERGDGVRGRPAQQVGRSRGLTRATSAPIRGSRPTRRRTAATAATCTPTRRSPGGPR